MSRALAVLFVAAATGHLIGQTPYLGYVASLVTTVASACLISAAVLSVDLAMGQAGERSLRGSEIPWPIGAAVIVGAPLIALVLTVVHFHRFAAYSYLVAVLVGFSAVSAAFLAVSGSNPSDGAQEGQASPQDPRVEQLFSRLFPGGLFSVANTVLALKGMPPRWRVVVRIGFLWGVAVLGHLLAPGSYLQTWILAPIFVMVVPGFALSFFLLPRSTPVLERLFWAPPVSLSVQVITLLWLNQFGIQASSLVFVLVATVFTLIGLVALVLEKAPASTGDAI